MQQQPKQSQPLREWTPHTNHPKHNTSKNIEIGNQMDNGHNKNLTVVIKKLKLLHIYMPQL